MSIVIYFVFEGRFCLKVIILLPISVTKTQNLKPSGNFPKRLKYSEICLKEEEKFYIFRPPSLPSRG